MAGETVKTPAICLAIRPWSRTSHVTAWLTPAGCVTTVVKGAVRPKSAFLGQYDLNYTCEILYYARAKGELHALRECTPTKRRDALRGDFRALALADWFRRLALDLAPTGPDAAEWFGLLKESLDGLERLGGLGVWRLGGLENPNDPQPPTPDHRPPTANHQPPATNHQPPTTSHQPPAANHQPPAANHQPPTTDHQPPTTNYLQHLLAYELAVLKLAGLAPEFGNEDGAFHLRGERNIPVPAEVIRCLEAPLAEKNPKIVVDAARVIGVFYTFHLDCAPDVRRTVLRMISQ